MLNVIFEYEDEFLYVPENLYHFEIFISFFLFLNLLYIDILVFIEPIFK